MKTTGHVIVALVIVFIVFFTLFYIFDNLDKIAERCKAGEELDICKQLSGFTLHMLLILLIIGGFVLAILSVVYILLSE